MIRGIMLVLGLILPQLLPSHVHSGARYNPDSVMICSQIITELTEGRVSPREAKGISMAIAQAANKHFGSVTAGDMWLFMAIAHVESGFRTNVVNYQNCRGMFQIHAPSWASKFGVKYADLLNPETNAEIGILVLKYYLELYKKIVPTLSAYNSDHPRAAERYAMAVLNTRSKIKKRYVQIHQNLKRARAMLLQ